MCREYRYPAGTVIIALIYVWGRLVASRRRDGASAQCATMAQKSSLAAPLELSHSSSASTTITTRFDVILDRGSMISLVNCMGNDFSTMSGSCRKTFMMTGLASGYDRES